MITALRTVALAAALGLSLPVLAEESHHATAPQTAQSPQPAPAPGRPMQPGMGPMGPGMMGQGGMGGMMGQGGMMGPGGMMGQGGMADMMPMMGMMQMMHSGQHIEGRLAFVKAELKITDAQEKAWNDFATALRQAAAKAREGGAAMRPMSGMAGGATPPELLDQHEKRLVAHLEALRIIKPALGSFYAGLNEDQKKTFTQVHSIFHGMI